MLFIAAETAFELVTRASRRRGQPAELLALLAAAGTAATVACTPLAAFQWYSYTRMCSGVAQRRAWCSQVPPLSYSFVQSNYWGVGLLSYWRIEQLPNFALALPISVWAVQSMLAALPQALGADLGRVERARLALAAHLGLMLLTGWLFMHVQVLTRFLSSSPLLYWLAARELKNSSATWARRFHLPFCLAYAALGAVLFPTHMPWT